MSGRNRGCKMGLLWGKKNGNPDVKGPPWLVLSALLGNLLRNGATPRQPRRVRPGWINDSVPKDT